MQLSDDGLAEHTRGGETYWKRMTSENGRISGLFDEVRCSSESNRKLMRVTLPGTCGALLPPGCRDAAFHRLLQTSVGVERVLGRARRALLGKYPSHETAQFDLAT